MFGRLRGCCFFRVGGGHPLIEKLMGPGTPLQISNSTPLNLKVCCCVGQATRLHPPAPLHPPARTSGGCYNCGVHPQPHSYGSPISARWRVCHGAQLGIITAAAPTLLQPSRTASTVAWVDAMPQAFFQTAPGIEPPRGRFPRGALIIFRIASP